MSLYLLDSNVLSEIVRDPAGVVAREFRRKSLDADATVLTSIVAASEMRYGLAKKASARLTEGVNRLLASIEVVPLGAGVDEAYGELRVDLERRGLPIGPNDMFLAAQALALDAVLVTDNVREFERVEGLRVENWLRSPNEA